MKGIVLKLSAWASKIIIDCTKFKEIFNVTRTIRIKTWKDLLYSSVRVLINLRTPLHEVDFGKPNNVLRI